MPQLADIRKDLTKRDAGAVFEYPRHQRDDDAPDSREWGTLTIAQWLNPNHRKRLAELLNERRADVRNENEEQAERALDEIEMHAVSETVLLGWENIWIGADRLDYSPDAAYRLLIDPQFEDFRRDVVIRAKQQAPYRFVEDEAGKKTSESAWNGKSDTDATSHGLPN